MLLISRVTNLARLFIKNLLQDHLGFVDGPEPNQEFEGRTCALLRELEFRLDEHAVAVAAQPPAIAGKKCTSLSGPTVSNRPNRPTWPSTITASPGRNSPP